MLNTLAFTPFFCEILYLSKGSIFYDSPTEGAARFSFFFNTRYTIMNLLQLTVNCTCRRYYMVGKLEEERMVGKLRRRNR